LYTDENPKDTVHIKFKTAQDIRDTLSKESFKSKTHARKSQIINLIHQRVRAAYDKSKNPEVKARLKRALDYIEQRKEASKKKTQQLQKESSSFAQQAAIAIAKKKSGKYDKEGKRIKETSNPQSGKAAPYGSGYAPVKNKKLEEDTLNEKCWPGYTKKGIKTMFGKKYPNCVKK
jgi:flagellar hook-basal body complex protein FliE